MVDPWEDRMKKVKRKPTLRQRRLHTPGYENMTPAQKKIVDRGGKVPPDEVPGGVISKTFRTLKEKITG
jgi:hypothetical protein